MDAKLEALITATGMVKVNGHDVVFGDVIERGKDLRPIFSHLKDDIHDPSTYEKPGRFTGSDGGCIESDPGYAGHVKSGGSKRKLKITSSRPFLPYTDPAWNEKVVDAITRYLITGEGAASIAAAFGDDE